MTPSTTFDVLMILRIVELITLFFIAAGVWAVAGALDRHLPGIARALANFVRRGRSGP